MSQTRIHGFNPVISALESEADRVLRVYLEAGRRDQRAQQAEELARRAGIAIETRDKRGMDKLVGHNRHQGVAADYRLPQAWSERELDDLLTGLDRPPFLLVLDSVQDPHNLGACLRSADAAGVDAVIVPRDRAASLTPTVIKVASGAAETVPLVQVTNLARTLRTLQQAGVWLVGLAGEGEATIHEVSLTGPLALVMGNEGKGLRELTRKHCDHLARIPMVGTVESLNVSVATGICLFEALRQRQA